MSETMHKTHQESREEPQELDELPSTDELMAEVDELLSKSADMLERIDMAAAPAQELPSMLDMLTDSARADTANVDRVGGQRSNTSNAAAWTIGGRVD